MNQTDNKPFAYKTSSELKRARFIFWIFKYPGIANALQQLLKIALKLNLPVGFILKKTVYGHFVGGVSIEKSNDVIERMAVYGVQSILDYSVEGGKDEKGFRHALIETRRTIYNASENQNIPFAVFKPSALTYEWVLKQENKPELDRETRAFEKRMCMLFKLAHDQHVPLLVDAEDVAFQDIIDHIVEKGMRIFNKAEPIVYQTLQMYRTDRLDYLKRLIQDAEKGNYSLGIKLVRGAYLEKEREIAAAQGQQSPVYPDKEGTDNAYNDALRLCMQHFDRVAVFNGTHNKQSCDLLKQLMKEKGLDNTDKNVYFAQLYGMSDDLSFNLASESYNVAKYLPYGPVKQVMPYLMRRAEENSAVEDQADNEYKEITNELKRRKQGNHGNKQ